MEKRMSVLMSLIFLVSFVEFCHYLAHDWRNLGSQVRLDAVFLAGLFLALMVQLWNEKSKTAWMLMTTATIAFATATHLVLH